MVALTAEIKNMDMVKTALKNDQPFHLSERKHPPAVIEFITPFPTPPPPQTWKVNPVTGKSLA